jgi:DNA sulfur modification protein DndC
MATDIERIHSEIRSLYLEDSIPWIIGYSGGKDSTACVQLIWNAVAALPVEQRTKKVHVISTDTLVENPVIAAWVEGSLETMRAASQAANLPIDVHRLTPSLANRFWVNLLGKGYPAPRPKFRWCTDRLKISASTKFIQELSETNGEAILVLGQRKGESSARDKVMDEYKGSTRERLSRNKDPKLSRVWVYLPIESWTSDDVWEYIVTTTNPWGVSNQDLFDIYRGATPDAECPIVVDTSTPSCGDSRFGCYVCTMVTQDKSMQAMVQNDEQKRWMQPILDFRNTNLGLDDRSVRDFRRMNGRLTVHRGDLVHGPYKQSHREKLVTELLRAEKIVRVSAQQLGLPNFRLIQLEELDEIRRIWVHEKGEIEDRLPQIYRDVYGEDFPGQPLEPCPLDGADLALLKQAAKDCEPDAAEETYRLVRNLLAMQFQDRGTENRSKYLDQVDEVLRQHAFKNADDALRFATSANEVGDGNEVDDEPSPLV